MIDFFLEHDHVRSYDDLTVNLDESNLEPYVRHHVLEMGETVFFFFLAGARIHVFGSS